MDERPEQARTALAAIKEASTEALGEVRAVLGVLRPATRTAPRAPGAGPGTTWTTSSSRTRVAGMQVRTSTTGEPRPLPPGSTWRPTGSSRRR